jgi:hypothetical protein
MRKFLIVLLLGVSAIGNHAYSQACLSNYKYRVSVALTNTNASPLSFFQVKVTVNTKTLIDSSKMRLDGGDIRFTNILVQPGHIQHHSNGVLGEG